MWAVDVERAVPPRGGAGCGRPHLPGRPDRNRGAPPGRPRGGPAAPRGPCRQAQARAPARLRQGRRGAAGGRAVALGAWYGARQVWFLGTDAAGRVALYRGLPYELPFGIKLYSEHFASPIQTGALPARRRDAVTGHDLRSREDAVSLIEDIQKSQGVP